MFTTDSIQLECLPIELLEQISRYILPADYHCLRMSSKEIRLPKRQTVTHAVYQSQIAKSKQDYSEFMKLRSLSNSHFCFLVQFEQWNHVREWVKVHDRFSDKLINDTFALGLYKLVPTDIIKNLYFTNRIPVDVNENTPIQVFSSLGCDDMVSKLLLDPRVDPEAKSNTALVYSCGHGHANVVKLLLSRVDPSQTSNQALQSACECGHVEVVRLLLKDTRVDPTDVNHWALRLAVVNNHVEIVDLLLEETQVDPSVLDQHCIRTAAENGFANVVRALCKDSRVDPSTHNNIPLLLASKNGHYETVKALLQDPRVDPTVRNHEALRLCFEFGHTDIALLLLDDFRNHTIKSIVKSFKNFTF